MFFSRIVINRAKKFKVVSTVLKKSVFLQSRSQSPRYPCPAERTAERENEKLVFPLRWTKVTRALGTRMVFLGLSRDAQNVCAVAKRGTVKLLLADWRL